jgi:peptidyl-prolyl cis-trans isomerase A (cyclophilin A)
MFPAARIPHSADRRYNGEFMKSLLVFFCVSAAALAQVPNKPGLYAVFETSMGNFTAKLYEKEAPKSVQSFVGLAKGEKPWLDPQTRAMVKRPLYDNIFFHRVIKSTVIQAGDPTGVGNHNCGVKLLDEFLPGLRFDQPGKLAVANTGQPDSGGCQFFITTEGVNEWNGKYTIFGDVVSGLDVARKISNQPSKDEKLITPVKLITVRIERVEKKK